MLICLNCVLRLGLGTSLKTDNSNKFCWIPSSPLEQADHIYVTVILLLQYLFLITTEKNKLIGSEIRSCTRYRIGTIIRIWIRFSDVHGSDRIRSDLGRIKTIGYPRIRRSGCCMYNVCNLNVIGPPPARSRRAFPASSWRAGGQLSHGSHTWRLDNIAGWIHHVTPTQVHRHYYRQSNITPIRNFK